MRATQDETMTLLLRGWTEVRGGGHGPITRCCSSSLMYLRRRAATLTVKCGACGMDELMPAYTYETFDANPPRHDEGSPE